MSRPRALRTARRTHAGRRRLASLRTLIDAAPPHLEPGGWLLLEHGATQARSSARARLWRAASLT